MISSIDSVAHDASTYKQAQENLRYFTEALENPNSYDYFRILAKVRQGKKNEPIWLDRVRKVSGQYVGKLTVTPKDSHHIRNYQEIAVNARDILDWNYQDKITHTIYGHFNACKEFKSLPVDEATDQMAFWNIACTPSEKNNPH